MRILYHQAKHWPRHKLGARKHTCCLWSIWDPIRLQWLDAVERLVSCLGWEISQCWMMRISIYWRHKTLSLGRLLTAYTTHIRWSRIPAIDLLNLPGNEGFSNQDLAIACVCMYYPSNRSVNVVGRDFWIRLWWPSTYPSHDQFYVHCGLFG